MSEAYKKLIKTLQNIFEMDKADLDFGIYRIMNQKREEINKFLNEDLLPQIKQAFEDFADKSNKQAHNELKTLTKTLEDAGMDPDSSPKILELKKQISNSVDITALENDVFSKLHTFFSRYYDKGDFISQRRYKPNTYAIPYEGEEVKLYWANHDQYYIKSSEHLRDYAFIAKDGQDNDQPFRIKLVEADIEKDNIKAKADEERRFVLNEEKPLSIENGELIIHFNYIPVGKKDQKKLNEDAVKTIFNQTDKEFNEWIHILKKPAPTEKNKDRTLLEKHIHTYTARNTFDYFIHKNLEDFLRRELDFFIKNEVLHLDDIDDSSFELTNQQLRKIRILRIIAHKIIRMLAQIEDFQKKLWLKKKFVVETNYCISLNKIPENLILSIAKNDNQVTEWVSLYSIDKNKLISDFIEKKPSEILETEEYKYLIVDTKYFDEEFKNKVIIEINNLDDIIDGLLVHSDNFQASNFILPKYSRSINGVYLDPPYNTDASEIIYKNGYKNSSWASLIYDRLTLIKKLQRDDGAICVTIDDFEKSILKYQLDSIYGNQNDLSTVVIRSNPQGRSTVQGFAVNHEYALFYKVSDNFKSVGRLGRSEKQVNRYNEIDDNGFRYLWENFRKTGTDSARKDRPKQFYPIIVKENGTFRIPVINWDDKNKVWLFSDADIEHDEQIVYPIDEDGNERVWKWGHERVKQFPNHLKVIFVNNNKIQLYRRNYLQNEGAMPGTWWDKPKYGAGSHGTNLLTAMFGKGYSFSFPKSLYAVEDCIKIIKSDARNTLILDAFAGSGTTGHAVLNINRFTEEKNKFILFEAGKHFDDVLIPRLKKTAYSLCWDSGKPVFADKYKSNIRKLIKELNDELTNISGFTDKGEYEYEKQLILERITSLQITNDALNEKLTKNKYFGMSVLYKYIRLESYEDTLNNLILSRSRQNQVLLDLNSDFREDYMLGYFMDIETSGSPSLLNIEEFEDPFNYKLNISSSSVGITKPIIIDLIETFNYLIGLKVKIIDVIRGFKIIVGTNLKDEETLIIWRNIKEKDNTQLEEFLDKQGYNPRDTEFQHIYINGDHTLEDPHSKVKMIEIEFKRLMFDVKDL
ncbi:DNA methyltransferase [Legionella pneumophila serogroup 2]|nr:site-specific DNA-methyltransferase [Legionella pneumophila]